MKEILTILYLFCLANVVNAQIVREDSIKNLLASAKDDTTKLKLLSNLVLFYTYSMPDTALTYAQEEISLAQKMKSDLALSAAFTGYGGLLSPMGNYSQAIYFGLEGLKAAERSKNFFAIGWSYDYLTSTYTDAGDYEHALFYSYKEKSLAEFHYKLSGDSIEKAAINDLYSSAMFGFAVIYDKLNQHDSALQYMQLVTQANTNNVGNASHFYLFGNIYLKKGDYFNALKYYRKGYKSAVDYRINSDIMSNWNGIAKTFWKMNQPDSSIFYADKVIEISSQVGYPLKKLEALVLLADIYKSKGNTDSAVKYLELTLATKDSLFNQQKVIQAQSMTFNEQLRRQDILEAQRAYQNRIKTYILIAGIIVLLLIASILLRSNKQKQRAKGKVEKAYSELKSTQSQLIQSEKMASLGELTAGIAHEIQNPLNFVNNFSEVNNELLLELKDEIDKGNMNEVKSIADNLISNQEKIYHHGKRADAIVKGMLQHSQNSTGIKEPTNINALFDEYLRLSYYGLRAKDKSFNSDFRTDFDNSIGKINIVPQDIGRVLLNLINNAFYAVNERKKITKESYQPTVFLSSRKAGDKVILTVKDNGNGIPPNIVDKIFQPFFTTKPTGQGTGLGLSLSYDIIKAHGGEIRVETKKGEGPEFIIQLPV